MSKQTKPNQRTKKASYTTSNAQSNARPAKSSTETQQPNNPNGLITCPTCKQPFPAKYRTCPRCPRQVSPIIKLILTLLFATFLLLSGLKTFAPTIYNPIIESNSTIQFVDKFIPSFNKPQGTYIVPD